MAVVSPAQLDTSTETDSIRNEASRTAPPLQSGDRLGVAEFHQRYAQHPSIKKAELVEGVVYVSSPVYTSHSKPHAQLVFWAGLYLAGTPSVQMGDNQSVRLDNDNEVQPDICLWQDNSVGKQISVTQKGLLLGSPDLVIEVAASSAAYDLHQKLRVYQRSGVREYLVFVAYEQEARWFHLVDGEFQPITADDEGVLRSRLFPGLWIHPDHVWQNDFAAMQTLLQAGLDSPEHVEFVKPAPPAEPSP
ncbi:MAG: Uma2 family endonuclease [Caldilineaceae bacterium]|nr:Uma2 family endonuclease [Caldilineaceae bacterium]